MLNISEVCCRIYSGGNTSKKTSKWEEAGQELEDYIKSVYSALLKNEYLRNSKIEKNHIEIGKWGTKRKFDVYYEVKIAGVTHKVAIECKYHNKRITVEMMDAFVSKLKDCNNIRGFMVSTNGFEEEARQIGKHNGIELITEDELPNMYGLLIAHTECLRPDECVHGYPFWTIMEVTEDGKNTGTYYSLGGNIVNILIPRPVWHGGRILLFISKKSAERVLKRTGVHGSAVFGVTREHLIGICHMAEEYNWPFAIASTLGFGGPDNGILMFEHSYDEILDHFDTK